MRGNFFIFGFDRVIPDQISFKTRFFRHVEIFYDHLRVSLRFGVKKSTILKNYLDGSKRVLYREGYPEGIASKILKRLKKLVKQIYCRLETHSLLSNLDDYNVVNGTPNSLFCLIRKESCVNT